MEPMTTRLLAGAGLLVRSLWNLQAVPYPWLLEKGANVGTRDDNGHTALDWGLRLGETDASRALRKVG